MGYNSRVEGSIDFAPLANYQQICEIQAALDEVKDFYGSVHLEVTNYRRHTPEGVLTVSESSSIAPISDEPHKAYTLIQELESLVTALLKQDPTREFSGYLDVEGEDSGDLVRYRVREGKIVKQTARIVFDD